jgi:hypothetical protein
VDRPQVRVKVTFPLETVMTLTKVTEAASDKVRFLDTQKDLIFEKDL